MLCKHCQKEIAEGEKFCRYCGQPQQQLCPKCGAVLSDTAKFCNACGQALTAAKKPAIKEKNHPWVPIAVIAVLCVALIVGGIWAVTTLSDNRQQPADEDRSEEQLQEKPPVPNEPPEEDTDPEPEEQEDSSSPEPESPETPEEPAEEPDPFSAAMELIAQKDYAAAMELLEQLEDHPEAAEQYAFCAVELAWQEFESCCSDNLPIYAGVALETIAGYDTDHARTRQDQGRYRLAELAVAADDPDEAEEQLAMILHPEDFPQLSQLQQDIGLVRLYLQARELTVNSKDTRDRLQALLDQLPEDFRDTADLQKKITDYDAAVAKAEADKLAAEAKRKEYWDKTAVRHTFVAGHLHNVVIKNDGTLAASGNNNLGQGNVSDWKNVIALAAGHSHTVGLKADWTVVATGNNNSGQCNVSGWKNIVAITAGHSHTVGIRSDGTVVAAGSNKDGKLNVSGWNNIVAVGAGHYHTVGLKADGTVVAVGSNKDGQCNVSGWRDIVAISVGANHTVGLKADGTVVATGMSSNGRCDVSGWKNIKAVYASFWATYGMTEDGSLLMVGSSIDGQEAATSWTDIVSISVSYRHTIGLKSDGTLVVVGWNEYGQCDVSGLTDIKLPAKP